MLGPFGKGSGVMQSFREIIQYPLMSGGVALTRKFEGLAGGLQIVVSPSF